MSISSRARLAYYGCNEEEYIEAYPTVEVD